MIYKIVYSNESTGELGRLPDFGIVNIGGVMGPTFTVDGRALLFADGSATDGSTPSLSVSLQGAYSNSTSPATINFTAGKDLILNAVNSKVFQFDADTGKVTITGDLEVLGSSTVIEGVISAIDQVSINAPDGTTASLLIEPMAGVVMTADLVRVQNQNGGTPVFVIDGAGNTFIRTLNVGGVPFTTFYNDFTTHIAAASGIKHAASQISVLPLTNFPGTDVQTVLEAIDTFVTGSGSGSVTSVAVTSADMTVTGSPITTAGTIDLVLNTVPIAKGGTGEVTATAAINALVPVQTGNSGKVLGTNGTAVAWIPVTASSSSAGLFFTDAAPTSSGIVGSKLYVSGTTPANRVINQATTDTNSVTVTLFAEGDSAFYSPTITITTVPAQVGGPIVAAIVEDPADKRAYTATANLTIVANTTVTGTSSTGAVAVMIIDRAAVGPTLSSLVITGLPGTQTEVKAGDLVQVSGTVQNAATYVEIIAGAAAGSLSSLTVGALDSGGAGFRTVSGTFVTGAGAGAQTVQARGRTVIGTYGAPFTSSNTVILNQTYPTIGARTIVYPVGQSGIKGAEAATVSSTITNFDTVQYTAVNMSVAAPTVYAVAKTVTRTSGTYVYNVQNYTITANKASNNATSVATTAVSIADVAPTAAITIVGSPVRLFSSAAGTDYTITITANQRLLSAPTLFASSGTFQGAWAGSGTTWTRVLRIVDTDAKGSQLFSALAVTGLAGLVGTAITSGAAYIVGGFASRIITFAPFERYHAIGTTVVDFSKVTASYTGSSVLARRTDTNDVSQSFTIVNAVGVHDPNGGYLFISDLAFSGANTSGTLQLTVAEAA